MAVIDNGIKIDLPESIIPSDFVPPAVTEFSDQESISKYTLNVLKSTVENADRATTLLNIIENAAIGLLKQINDIIVADYIGTNTVEYFSKFKILGSNSSRSTQSDFLTSNAFNYVCEVEVYVKTS